MKLLGAFEIAVSALRRNMLRAGLTAIGIIIGIASVIVMMQLGQGSSAAIQRSIASMGANTILIVPGVAASGGVSYGGGTSLTLTVSDAEAILREAPAVASGALLLRARTQVVASGKNWVPQNMFGTSPEFLKVRGWQGFSDGTMFTDRDVTSVAEVCVIGKTLARELFGTVSPIGKEVRVMNVALKVRGVLAAKGANMMGMDQDDILLMPWTTMKYRVTSAGPSSAGGGTASPAGSGAGATAGSSSSTVSLYPTSTVKLYPDIGANSQVLSRRAENVDQILLAARSQAEIQLAMTQVKTLLRQRHRTPEGEPEDFSIRDMTEMSSVLSSTSTLMTRLLLGVACISLLVGGVGIMNIMLVSVTERTREIGLRMAVGATSSDIMRQFLVEAIVLCLVGGCCGIALGIGVSELLGSVLRWPIEASPSAIISSLAVSCTVGVVFGYYPAARASRLDPIEALRYE